MAAQHLTALSSPEFPQVFEDAIDFETVFSSPAFPQVFEDAIDFEIRRVDRILAQSQLGQCNFSDEHCDCRAQATVHHLASEQEFCARHFQAVTRG